MSLYLAFVYAGIALITVAVATLVNVGLIGLRYCIGQNRQPESALARFCGEEWDPASGLLLWGLPLASTALVAFWLLRVRKSERFPWLAIVTGLAVNALLFLVVDQLPGD